MTAAKHVPATAPDLFDTPLDRTRRMKTTLVGMAEGAVGKLAPGDSARVQRALEVAAALGQPFTADDIMAGLGEDLQARLRARPNSLGGLFHLAARRGTIRKTGRVTKSLREEARGREIHLWEARPQ